MEDIKNINTSKAKYQAAMTARENKRRNRKPTSFFEFFTVDLSKTPAGKARAKAEGTREKTKKKKLDRNIVKAREKRDINLIISRAEKAQKKKDNFKGLDAPSKSSDKKLSKFQQAFADARKAGKRTFRFTNKAGKTTTYTTRLQTESKDAFEKKFKKGKK